MAKKSTKIADAANETIDAAAPAAAAAKKVADKAPTKAVKKVADKAPAAAATAPKADVSLVVWVQEIARGRGIVAETLKAIREDVKGFKLSMSNKAAVAYVEGKGEAGAELLKRFAAYQKRGSQAGLRSRAKASA